MDMNERIPNDPFNTPPTGPPTGSKKINGPVVVGFWDPSRPTTEWIETGRWRDPANGGPLVNWKNPADDKWYAVYLYDYYEEEHVFEAPGP